ERACALVESEISIVPFYLRGLWGSQFSRSSARLKQWRGNRLKRDLIVAFGPPLSKSTGADVLKRRVFDLSIASWRHYVADLPTLAQAWLEAAKKVGNNLAIADSHADPLTGAQSIAAVLAFARRIGAQSQEQNIGLLLPTSSGGTVANMAALCAGKTVVNLNYTASAEAIAHALDLAQIKTVYSSRRFLEKLQQRNAAVVDCFNGVNVIYLEDVRAGIGRIELVARWLCALLLPGFALKRIALRYTDADSTAVILFSSGSEGLPKGVMLSHRNILANVRQIADVLNLEERDVVMASLPLFHAFGLTVTTFMPLLEGVPMVCHPDPTDAVGVAKAIAEYRATVLCGTATFLRLYTRHP